MCNPALWYAAATLAVGAYSANAQRQMGKYNAAVQRNNALAQKYQAEAQADRLNTEADSVMKTGWAAEREQRIETARKMGAQRAAFAGSGVELSGTPSGVIADTKAEGERDALTIRANAAREAWGLQTQAQDTLYRGSTAYSSGLAQAEGTEAGAKFGATSTLLGSATQAYGGYQQMKALESKGG